MRSSTTAQNLGSKGQMSKKRQHPMLMCTAMAQHRSHLQRESSSLSRMPNETGCCHYLGEEGHSSNQRSCCRCGWLSCLLLTLNKLLIEEQYNTKHLACQFSSSGLLGCTLALAPFSTSKQCMACVYVLCTNGWLHGHDACLKAHYRSHYIQLPSLLLGQKALKPPVHCF